MAVPARRSAAAPAVPEWGEVRAAVTRAAGTCSPGDAAVIRRALAYGEALIEAEAVRRADEILAAAGLVPPPRRRHLHAVS